MATGAATLTRVLLKATANGRSYATDQELLRRFADNGDQSAFEVLVRRHTALVLSVCRRSLANIQDAEDACQATFLILARKARGGRWQPSIVSWLFATARRVSRDLRRTAQRRTKREGKAAVPESVLPVDRMTGREMLAVIDEELDRLPSIYRNALLLYYHAERPARNRLTAQHSRRPSKLVSSGRRNWRGATKRGIVASARSAGSRCHPRAGVRRDCAKRSYPPLRAIHRPPWPHSSRSRNEWPYQEIGVFGFGSRRHRRAGMGMGSATHTAKPAEEPERKSQRRSAYSKAANGGVHFIQRPSAES